MDATPRLNIRPTGEGTSRRITLAGDLDLVTGPNLEAALMQVCDDGARQLTIDLRSVSFIDSSGLFALIQGQKTCAVKGIEYGIILGPTPIHRRLFQIAGLQSLVEASAEGDGDGELGLPQRGHGSS